MAFMDPINPPTIQNHLAFTVADDFFQRHGRFPGSSQAFSASITGSSSTSSSSSSLSNPTSPSRRRSPWRTDSSREPEAKRQKSESPFPADTDGDARMRDSSVAASHDDESNMNVEADEKQALEYTSRVLALWGLEEEDQVNAVKDAVKELTRSGHGDVASTASLLGGVAAQEAIKLITKQYIPLEGTAVYDGIKQAIGTFDV